MRKVIDNSKKVFRYAKAVRDVVDKIPSAAGDINRMVSNASSALQQIRLDATDVISGLKTERDEDFVDIIKEATLNQEYILSRGYFLSGVNLNLGSALIFSSSTEGPGGRLTLHLRNIAAGQTGDYFRRDLPQGWDESPTMQAVLFAIERAAELSSQISDFGFVPHEIQVVAGSSPSIQVFWKNLLGDEAVEGSEVEAGAGGGWGEGGVVNDASASNLTRGATWRPEEGFFPPATKDAEHFSTRGGLEKEKNKIPETKIEVEVPVPPGSGEVRGASHDPLAKFKIRPRVSK